MCPVSSWRSGPQTSEHKWTGQVVPSGRQGGSPWLSWLAAGLGHFSPPGQMPTRPPGTRDSGRHVGADVQQAGSKSRFGETPPPAPLLAGPAGQVQAGVFATDLRGGVPSSPWTSWGLHRGLSTPHAPRCHIPPGSPATLAEHSLNFIFRQYFKNGKPYNELLLDRTDHSDLSGGRRIPL